MFVKLLMYSIGSEMEQWASQREIKMWKWFQLLFKVIVSQQVYFVRLSS